MPELTTEDRVDVLEKLMHGNGKIGVFSKVELMWRFGLWLCGALIAGSCSMIVYFLTKV